MIPVTKTFLPPQEEFNAILKRAWDKRWITNEGALFKELESALKGHLAVQNIILMTNGTLPLQIAIKAMGLTGEIITTPFSYVATSSAIVWEQCTPVYADIDPIHLTLDETRIEAAITPRTTGILATHVFGNPCHMDALEAIARKHNLRVIYDAAHCFGVTFNGKSIFEFGDASTCSFHATKIFHTGEGGCIVANDDELHRKLYYHHNFGHKNTLEFHGLGINAKMNELQAAMGLAVLPYWEHILANRRRVCETYWEHLRTDNLQTIQIRPGARWNYSYFPVIFESEEKLLEVEQRLHKADVVPRRYFYPSLNHLPYVESKGAVPVSERISKSILCLPCYVDLASEDVVKICKIINDCL